AIAVSAKAVRSASVSPRSAQPARSRQAMRVSSRRRQRRSSPWKCASGVAGSGGSSGARAAKSAAARRRCRSPPLMRLAKHCASRAQDCATKSLAANTAWIESRMAAGALASAVRAASLVLSASSEPATRPASSVLKNPTPRVVTGVPVKSRVLSDSDRPSVTTSAIFSGWLVPDVAPEIVERRGVEPATQAPEARGCGIHLRAIRGIDRGRIALDQTVVDVDVGGAGRDPDPGGADMAVGDVNLAAVLRAHRVAVELEVAVVDVQQPRALAHDRLVAPLECGAGDGAIAQPPARGRRRGG